MVERGIKDHSIRWVFNLSNPKSNFSIYLIVWKFTCGWKYTCAMPLNFFRTNKLENTDSVLRNIESVTVITLGLKIFRLLVLGFLILNQIPIIGFVAISNTDGFCLLVSQFPKSTYWSTYLLFDRKWRQICVHIV